MFVDITIIQDLNSSQAFLPVPRVVPSGDLGGTQPPPLPPTSGGDGPRWHAQKGSRPRLPLPLLLPLVALPELHHGWRRSIAAREIRFRLLAGSQQRVRRQLACVDPAPSARPNPPAWPDPRGAASATGPTAPLSRSLCSPRRRSIRTGQRRICLLCSGSVGRPWPGMGLVGLRPRQLAANEGWWPAARSAAWPWIRGRSPRPWLGSTRCPYWRCF